MTLLVVSPDYASHLLPLLTLASAWRPETRGTPRAPEPPGAPEMPGAPDATESPGERVVVATGPATRPLVEAAGFEWVELSLGRGSNPGVIRAEQQPPGEDDRLRGFFAATRLGMLATLSYQAAARQDDLLWDPVRVGRRVLDIVERVRPDEIVVDHLAFGATLALRAAGVPYGDVVLGHPTALPVGDEVYGVPDRWPACFDAEVDDEALAELRRDGERVRDRFTEQYVAAMEALAPTSVPGAPSPARVDDAFAAHGPLVLYNHPAELRDRARDPHLSPHVFLGSCVRAERPPEDVARWLDATDRPLVVVSFGTFLSQRADVLARVVAGLRPLDVRVALATGSTDPAELGPTPDDWLLRPYLPQVALFERAALAVTHGGNNSVTEALTAGVPMLVMPFSTDQFVGAADVETHGVGRVLPPNRATPDEITAAVRALLDGPERERTTAVGATLRADPGPQRARRALAAAR